MPLVDPVYTGIQLGDPANICRVHWNTTEKKNCCNSPTLECHWRNLVETAPHWDATGEILTFAAYTGTPLARDCNSLHTQAHVLSMPVWNDKMAGHQSASGQVSVTSAFTWSLLLYNGYQFCSKLMWVLQQHSVHAFDMSTIIVLVYLGLQVKWIQSNPNNSHHTSCIHKGLHVVKWPDLMTCKPDSVSTLGYHCYFSLHFSSQVNWPYPTQLRWRDITVLCDNMITSVTSHHRVIR